MTNEVSDKGAVLIVDDTPANLNVLVEYLDATGFEVLVARDGESALQQLDYSEPDLILMDVQMPGIDGFETCRRLRALHSGAEIPVIFMTALADTKNKLEAFKAGAVDYVTKPLQHQEVLARITTHLSLRRLRRHLQEANETLERRVAERTEDLSKSNALLQQEIAVRKTAEEQLRGALSEVSKLKDRLEAENLYLQNEIGTQHNFGEIIGASTARDELIEAIETVAPTDANVLITGETGTGKELVARAIHSLSARKGKPLIKVNCASIPRDLFESEFFGHVRGAFTGAVKDRSGRFQLADQGTLFLDELGEIPIEMQSKLLRVLQEGEYERIGDEKTRRVDVRIIGATNRDLAKEIGAGRFREDLYYRLNVFPIDVCPLRNRKGDVLLLAAHFIELAAKKMRRPSLPLTPQNLSELQSYHWPGNVRELQNIMERAVITASSGVYHFDLKGKDGSGGRDQAPMSAPAAIGASAIQTDAEMRLRERENILAALTKTDWQIAGDGGAAAILAMNPTTLASRLRKMGLNKPAVDNN